MLNNKIVAEFFDRKGPEFEESRYTLMREIRATVIRKEIIGNDILDVGCHCGHLIKEYRDGENVTGVDISPVCIEYAQKLVSDANFFVGSAEDIPVKDSSYDSIICSEALYYVNDPQLVINNFLKKLRPGGKCIIISSNQLHYRIAKAIGVPLGLIPKDICEYNFYAREVIRLLKNAFFGEIKAYGVATIPIRQLLFLDKFFPNSLGMVQVITGKNLSS